MKNMTNLNKFLYLTLKMGNLSDKNDLYSFQDTCLLFKILENWSETIHKICWFIPWKCNSASALSGCIEKEMPKVILSLPPNKEVVQVFESRLTGWFSCVNTRLVFDTEILMPNISRAKFDKMMTDESFQAFKRQDFKAEYMYIIKYYRIKLDGEKTYTDKRVISKILKLDENNEYVYAFML